MLFHTITCHFLVFLHKIGILTSILAPFRYCDPSKNPSASYPYDEMGESESESITSEPNIDLGVFDEQICGPLPSNDDHVNASPSKYNTTDLVNKNLPKKLEITYNQTLQAIMNEPSGIISEPSVPNLKYEKPDPQKGDDDDDQPIKLSEG